MSDCPPDPRSRLTPAQDRFLKALELDCDAHQPPTRILAAIKPTLLARWLAQPTFRRHLLGLLGAVRHRAEMSLWLAAARAAERITGGVDAEEKLDPGTRRTCLDLIRLARQSPFATANGGGERTADSDQRSPSQEALVHPDLSLQEAQALIEKLK